MDKNSITHQQFSDWVFSHLSVLDDDDAEADWYTIKQFYKEGWTRGEVLSFLNCMEHRNPELEEDTALKQMARIRKSVAERLQ